MPQMNGIPAKRDFQEEPLLVPSEAHRVSNKISQLKSPNLRPKWAKLSQEEEVVVPGPLVSALYSESVVVKFWNVASSALGSSEPPVLYPEHTGQDGVHYVYRSLDFWTSGFFPGSLYLLLERQICHPRFHAISTTLKRSPLPHQLQLEHLCRWWTANLHKNATLRDTHDLGFMIGPWAMKAWSLLRDPDAYSTLVLAAHSLASRFDERVQSLRSCDTCSARRYSFSDTTKDFLVIIDNMLNLDLLFWVAKETGDRSLYNIAVMHARTTQKHHVRSDRSTCHVVNYDPATGEPKSKFTHQGYSDESCWARGQSWGILGFMQTYKWTRDTSFLTTARELAEYFISHLPDDGVPSWDLDSPVTESSPRDTSAGMVACCGMLLIYKALKPTDPNAAQRYLDHVLCVLRGTVSMFMPATGVRFAVEVPETMATYPEDLPEEKRRQPGRLIIVEESTLSGKPNIESILDGATVNNYEFATRRWADHGLVYADYYFMLLGNMLLDMGLV